MAALWMRMSILPLSDSVNAASTTFLRSEMMATLAWTSAALLPTASILLTTSAAAVAPLEDV